MAFQKRAFKLKLLLLIACLAAAGCGDHTVADKRQAAARFDRGVDLALTHRYRESVRELNEAVRMDPDVQGGLAHCVLASIYATCPDASFRDGDKAVVHANLAVKIACSQRRDWGIWWAWAALASAYAEKGEFDRAIAAQQRAIELADQCDEEIGPRLQRNVRACLRLYESQRPLRTGHITVASLGDAWAQRVFSGDFPEIAE